MKLSEEIKLEIKKEFEAFKHKMYDGKTLEERKELDQFFTPPQVTIPLLENLETVKDIDILDPTSGSGNLLIACIIAGASPARVFGNDYDAAMVKVCKDRLNKYCKEHNLPEVPKNNIHRGNALQKRCLTEFNETYAQNYRIKYIDDLQYAQGKYSWDEDNRLAEARSNTEIEYYDLFGGTK